MTTIINKLPENIAILHSQDGFWLEFKTTSGDSALINLGCAFPPSDKINAIIWQWANEQIKMGKAMPSKTKNENPVSEILEEAIDSLENSPDGWRRERGRTFIDAEMLRVLLSSTPKED